MSIHPSLSPTDKHKRHKSVLKRFERLKDLLDKDKWNEGDSVFSLPKTKIVKMKLKKEKAVEEAPAAAVGAEGVPSAQAKGPAEGKESPAKGAAPGQAKEKPQQEKKK